MSQPSNRGADFAKLSVASLVVVTFMVACADMSETSSSGQVSSAEIAMPGTALGLPANAPDRFDFGVEASEQRVAMWDIDVRPDGVGLPEGSGSVQEGRDIYNIHCIACHGLTELKGPTIDWSIANNGGMFLPHEPWGTIGPMLLLSTTTFARRCLNDSRHTNG